MTGRDSITSPGVSRHSSAQGWENGQSGTGRRSNVDPLLDRIDLVYEGSGPVAILPEAHSTVSNPPDLYATRMARVDGCPSCVVNAEKPSSVYPDPPRGFVANYICESCGHAWTTSWED